MDRALEHGINFFDTANVYGWKTGEGITEQIIGRWFAQGGGRRDKVVLATKVYGKMGDWPNDAGPVRAAHRPGLRGLAAPAADRLDRPLPDAPRLPEHPVGGDLAGDGDRWCTQGKVLLRRLVQLRRLAPGRRRRRRPARRNFLGLVSEQCIYNLLTRHVELEVMPAAQPLRHRHHPVVAAARRAARRRAAQASARAPPPGPARAGRWTPWTQHRAAIEAYEKLCAELGARPGRRGAGLAAVPPRRHRPDHRPAYRRAARQFAARPGLSGSTTTTLTRLDELFPPIGNGGPGPEAWAW